MTPDSLHIANALADTTTLRSLVGLDPNSAWGQLVYPFAIFLLTNFVKLAKGAVAKWPQAFPQITALVLGLLTSTLVEGHGFTLKAILSGFLLGLAGVGFWETVGKRAVAATKTLRGPALLMVGLLLTLALIFTAYASKADARPIYDPHRLSLGVGAAGVVYEDHATGSRSSGCQFYGYGSWALTNRLSIAALPQRDFARHLNEGELGVRFAAVGYNPGDKMQVGLGVGLLAYGDRGANGFRERTSWAASIRLSFSVVRKNSLPARDIVFATSQVQYDPENGTLDAEGRPGGIAEYKLGPRLQFVGGKWGD